MKRSIAIMCTALSVAALAAMLPVEASAQKRSSVSSTKSQGAKAGGSIYKPKKSHAVVPRRVVKNKPRRRHGASPTSEQMRRSAELAARRASKASSILSRATNPLAPKIDTSRMSMDVNASGGKVRSKPVTPPPPTVAPPPLPPSRDRRAAPPRRTTDAPRQPMPRTLRQAQYNAKELAREVKPLKVKVKGMQVPEGAKQRGILIAQKRSQAIGRSGLTFNGKDEFQSVNGRITTARNGRGDGLIDRTIRFFTPRKGER